MFSIWGYLQKRISLQLLFWFLLIEFPAEFALVYASYYQAKSTLQAEIIDKLNSIAERQILEINNYIKQEEIDLTILSNTSDIINAVKELNESYEKYGNDDKHATLIENYTKELLRYQKNFEFEHILVLNLQGEVTFSNSISINVGKKISQSNFPELTKLYERVFTLLQVEFSDFISLDNFDKFVIFGGVPIRNREGRFLGVVLAEINSETIEKAINNYTGLGRTGESLLFFQKNETVYFATNSRFQKATHEAAIPYNPQEMPKEFFLALQGQKGQMIAHDYKGISSVIKYAYVPSLRAGIIVKIATEEAFKPIETLQRVLFVIVVLTLAVVIFVAFKVASTFTKPIRRLSYVVQAIAQGNLEKRSDTQEQNEIGQLAQSINQMAETLQKNKEELEAYNQELEEKVAQRTAELEITLKQVQKQKEELLVSEEELRQTAEEMQVINEALSQKEKRFRKIIEDNVIGMAILSNEMIVFANQSFVNTLEYHLEEIFGKSLEEMVTPLYRQSFKKFLANFEQATETDKNVPNRMEVKIYTKKRKTIWADLSLVHVNFEGADSVLVNLVDITEKKNAEIKIKESERKFKAIFENIQEGFLQVSEYGEILMANDQAAKILGYQTAADLKGKIIQDDIYLNPEDREKMHQAMNNNNGKVDNYEVSLKKADGTPIVVEFDKHYVKDENGQLIFIEGLFRDITQRKMQELALKEANDRLIASQEELQQNAEELATVNENLNKILAEVKETNIQLEISREMLARQKANIERDNKILVQLAQNQAIQAGDWQEALQIITRITAKRLYAERVGIWNIENESTLHLNCICMYDAENKEYISQPKMFQSAYPTYFENILTGNVINAIDAIHHPHTQEFAKNYFLENNIKSTLDVPFFGRNGVAGVLRIEGKYTYRDWEAEDITFAKSIADMITIAYKSYQRKLAEDQLAKQNAIIQKKNDDIIDSINYASRIQNAILPTDTFIESLFEEYFVLFKPRDIVSGDFYWFSKVENKIIATAVDCTGHGVPGAFMSMIGTQMLNEIVNRRKVIKPHVILTELHKSIRRALKQDDMYNRDGMDMAIIAIDKETQTMEFAGAKNPIVYIQNKQLFYIKGTKFPIGGEQREEERLYELHTIDISQPTSVYLFTDGYQDQFGGKEVKKFMIANLRNLFLEIHEEPMIIQREILNNTIEQWKEDGKQNQVDDILIIGLRV
ncbi:MAG: PAS domain S-box protein [Microscillaceae bacterium]|nr:PAS domain S-box protein [Microscillaceae bacterium]MDW8459977.1 PAS domain S-box protein [Cytophagales bacterium]